jgi:hypothetical protein
MINVGKLSTSKNKKVQFILKKFEHYAAGS